MPVIIDVKTGEDAVLDRTTKKGSAFKLVTDTQDKQWYVYDKDLFDLMVPGAKLEVSYDTSEYRGKTYYQIVTATSKGAAPGSPAAAACGMSDHTDAAVQLLIFGVQSGLIAAPEDGGTLWLVENVCAIRQLLDDSSLSEADDEDIPFGEE